MTEGLSQIGNIDTAGRRRRLAAGLAGLAAAAGLTVWLVQAGAGRLWLLALFSTLWLGMLGILQAQAHT